MKKVENERKKIKEKIGDKNIESIGNSVSRFWEKENRNKGKGKIYNREI